MKNTQTKEILNCRVCGEDKILKLLNLGNQPLANDLQDGNKKNSLRCPLILCICESCSTVQLSHTVNPEILFKKYLWVTSTSKTAKEYAETFFNRAISNLDYKPNLVYEIASNHGTFLKPFIRNLTKCIGIDPAENIAKIANIAKVTKIAEILFFVFLL